MKDAIQAVLIDPNDASRADLERLLGAAGCVWLSEVLPPYAGAARRVAEVTPHLVVINVDGDATQAVTLIQTIVQACPGVAVLPASRVCNSSIILSVVRAGAREFL